MARRVLLAAVVALLTGAAGAQAAEPPFTSSPVSRYGGDQPGGGLEDGAGRNLRQTVADLPIRIRPSRAVCAAGLRARWTLDGRVIIPRPDLGQEPSSCAWTLLVQAAGPRRLAVDTGRGPRSRTVEVRDRLVVTLGDSVASGEGNPRRGARRQTWLERICHRSSRSGFEVAARRVARRNERSTSITFVNLACSGATVRHGLEGPYSGIEPRRGAAPLLPQLDRLEALKRARGRVDAVMVSLGANDASFGAIVALCARPGSCPDAKLGGRRAGVAVGELLGRLPDGYARVAQRLARVVDEPGDVLLTEYFDPLHDINGRFCRHSLGAASQADLRWAEQGLLLPLNDATRVAAATHGWTHVGGIRRSFARHGYCAGRSRWIVRIDDSLLKNIGSPNGPRLKGTMHPNASGHEAIAGELAPRLARRLGMARPVAAARAVAVDPDAPVQRGDDGGDAWPWFAGGAVALLLLAQLWRLARDWAVRLSLLVRPSHRPDPVGLAHTPPTPRAPLDDRSWTALLALASKAVGGALAGTGTVLLLGAAILWVRYAAVGVPAGQGVNAAGEREWLVTGWYALLVFAVLGGFAVLLARALDDNARASRPTRRALVVVLVLEVALAVAVGDFRTGQGLQILGGMVTAVLLVNLLLDRATLAAPALSASRLELAGRWLLNSILGPAGERTPLRIALRLIPLVALLGAVAIAARAERADRLLIVLPLLAAALLFTARGGIAQGATSAGDPGGRAPIETPRTLIAAALLLCLAILLGRDELWLLGAVVAAAGLAVGCLVVAASTGRRFGPYALAVFVSVPLYGATVASLRAINQPELQPLAAITPDGRAVCGVYVGRTDGRVWYGLPELKEDVPSKRTDRLRGRLASVPDEAGTEVRIAPLQSLPDAQARAVQLRDELLAERRRPRGGPTCTTPAAPARAPTRDERRLRRLADRFAPDLTMARDDGFPPASVQTMFALRDRRRQLCRRVDADHCLRVAHQGKLPWTGGQGEYLDYPADPSSRAGQRDQVLRTQASADPEANAAAYFLVSGGEARRPVSLQYWFFYPFNFQRVELGPGGVTGGFHEGDFETVGVVLSASRRPRYVLMARHDNEGRAFAWNETALETEGRHVRAYAARGSHASYERCGRHRRPVGGSRVDDRAPCDDQAPLRFTPEATPRTDLSRVGWACWQGRFGQSAETNLERLPQVVNDGPRSPLWQQSFGGVRAQPCRDTADPGSRQGPAEEVLDAATATRLRARAGRLTPLIDDCADWERPPLEGVYVVACDDAALDAYVASGLEEGGPEQVRISRPGDPRRTPTADIPAVQRDPEALRPAAWRITAKAPARRTIFVSCRQGKRVLEARFEDVRLLPGRTYAVDDRGPEVWRLRSGDDVVAQAEPVNDGVPVTAAVDCSLRG